MSLKEKIRKADDIKKETVPIPAWDCSIELRTMTAKQRAYVLNESMDENTGKIQHDKLHAQMLIACCFDPENGEKLFSADDSEWLMEKSSGPVELLVSKAMRLSGLTKDAAETAEKN